MHKAAYYKIDGKKGRAHLANKRQGTASAKTRSDVKGGGRKPFRQKGTGRARQGTIRAAQMEGGGVAFPPIPHSWNQKVPRKVKGLARRSALNARAEEDRVILIDALEFEAPKTARLRDYLGSIEVEGKVLLLTEGMNRNVYLSARNLTNIQVRPFGEESTYDILWATKVVIERGALDNAEAPTAAEDEEAPDA